MASSTDHQALVRSAAAQESGHRSAPADPRRQDRRGIEFVAGRQMRQSALGRHLRLFKHNMVNVEIADHFDRAITAGTTRSGNRKYGP
jgi:hypothetical protein